MGAEAGRAVVAEHATSSDAGAVIAIEIPVERRCGPLAAADGSADIETGAPAGHAVARERVAGDAKRVCEEVKRAAVGRLRLRAGILVDEIALNGDRVFVGGVVEEARATAPARVLSEHIAFDAS